jgi:hypothetical protein
MKANRKKSEERKTRDRIRRKNVSIAISAACFLLFISLNYSSKIPHPFLPPNSFMCDST